MTIARFSFRRVLLALMILIIVSGLLVAYPFALYGDLPSFWASSSFSGIWPAGVLASLILITSFCRIVIDLVFWHGRALTISPDLMLQIRTDLFVRTISLVEVEEVKFLKGSPASFIMFLRRDHSKVTMSVALLKEHPLILVKTIENLMRKGIAEGLR